MSIVGTVYIYNVIHIVLILYILVVISVKIIYYTLRKEVYGFLLIAKVRGNEQSNWQSNGS